MKPFAVMFHHFHNYSNHIVSQGSIDANDFRKMLDYLKNKYSILDANSWYEKACLNQLEENEICLSFDDSLACQYDIAYPILEEINIKAFWFVYSSPLVGILEKLEIFRYFRFKNFKDIDSFYDAFFLTLKEYQCKLNIDFDKELTEFVPDEYLKEFSFYTYNDKKFRFTRDVILKQNLYYFVMDKMMENLEHENNEYQNLWLDDEKLFNLYKNGHIIGLHSHTHPTKMSDLLYEQQLAEYKNNKEILENILNTKIISMSHPCNSYNEDTDCILRELNIQLGFDSNMKDRSHSILHMPRTDHADILKEMRI